MDYSCTDLVCSSNAKWMAVIIVFRNIVPLLTWATQRVTPIREWIRGSVILHLEIRRWSPSMNPESRQFGRVQLVFHITNTIRNIYFGWNSSLRGHKSHSTENAIQLQFRNLFIHSLWMLVSSLFLYPCDQALTNWLLGSHYRRQGTFIFLIPNPSLAVSSHQDQRQTITGLGLRMLSVLNMHVTHTTTAIFKWWNRIQPSTRLSTLLFNWMAGPPETCKHPMSFTIWMALWSFIMVYQFPSIT